MEQRTLLPEYMKSFQCIGGDCEDTCCSGWAVTIDKKTYKNYQKVQDLELKNKLQNSMRRVKEADFKSDEIYARFLMGQNNCCNMLTEDKWCQIQKELGEEALSVTCASYPRNLNKLDQIYELSARVSCPEVARLALLEPKGIDFEELDFELSEALPFYKTQHTSSTALGQYFWSIRMLGIEIIQNRTLSVSDRIVSLGVFVHALQNNIDQSNGAGLGEIIDYYRVKLSNTEYLEWISSINSNLDVQLQVIYEITKYRINMGIASERYLQTVEEMLVGLGQESNKLDIKLFKESYVKNYQLFYSPYFEEKSYILENYIVNLLFNTLFPNLNKNSVDLYGEFVSITVIYAMLRVHLVGVAGKNKGLDDNLVIRTIQSFAKMIEHNEHYIKTVINELKANNHISLAHMTMLVKDMNESIN